VIQGTAAASTLYLHGSFEIRWNARLASAFVVRAVPLQVVQAGARAVLRPDPWTTVEVVGGAAYRPAGTHAIQAGFVTAWSWEHLQLMAGAVYGRPILPIVSLPMPRDPLWLPEFDVAWVF
jgi:hypothetical protein